MRDVILSFPEQLKFEPILEHGELLHAPYSAIIVAGMGGSHLAADFLHAWKPELPIKIHKDYGIPAIHSQDPHNILLIASSYSGNTEETIDAFKKAGEKSFSRAVITTGGALLDLAKAVKVPYVLLPPVGIQPRSALGFSLKALLKILGQEEALQSVSACSETLHPEALEEEGRLLAERIGNRIPLICASGQNAALAQNWKIKSNETAKIPAFYSVFPELNHNEMTGFDTIEKTKPLAHSFFFLFLKDSEDDPRNQKRMEVTAELYRDRGLKGEIIKMEGEHFFEKALRTIILADWTAYHIALRNGANPGEVPMVEEFKKRLA